MQWRGAMLFLDQYRWPARRARTGASRRNTEGGGEGRMGKGTKVVGGGGKAMMVKGRKRSRGDEEKRARKRSVRSQRSSSLVASFRRTSSLPEIPVQTRAAVLRARCRCREWGARRKEVGVRSDKKAVGVRSDKKEVGVRSAKYGRGGRTKKGASEGWWADEDRSERRMMRG